MAYLMGIDLGSTSIKAIVYDEKGGMIAKGSAVTPLSYLDPEHPAWCVWEPDKLWDHTALAIRQALSAVKDPADICGVAGHRFRHGRTAAR